KRIVATDLAEIRHYLDYVTVANDQASWLAALEQSLGTADQMEAQRLIEFGRRNSWDHRLAQTKALIDPLFPKASIIIVTYNNVDYTRLCLESVVTKTSYPCFD